MKRTANETYHSETFHGVPTGEEKGLEWKNGIPENWQDELAELTVEIEPEGREEGCDAVFTLVDKEESSSVALPLLVATGLIDQIFEAVGVEKEKGAVEASAEFTIGRQERGAQSAKFVRFIAVTSDAADKKWGEGAPMLLVLFHGEEAISADGQPAPAKIPPAGITLLGTEARRFLKWVVEVIGPVVASRGMGGSFPLCIKEQRLYISGPQIRITKPGGTQ